jgi:hypothetical protein
MSETAFSALDRGRDMSGSYPRYIRLAFLCSHESAVFSSSPSTDFGTAFSLLPCIQRKSLLNGAFCNSSWTYVCLQWLIDAKSLLQGRHGGSTLPPGSFIATADGQIESSHMVCYSMPRPLPRQFKHKLTLHSLQVDQDHHLDTHCKAPTTYLPHSMDVMEEALFLEMQLPSRKIAERIM